MQQRHMNTIFLRRRLYPSEECTVRIFHLFKQRIVTWEKGKMRGAKSETFKIHRKVCDEIGSR
jgi:hypothetical protein